MKVGDYVRTKDYLGNQLINKIKKVYDDGCIHTGNGYWDTEHIIKSSPNLIDLIEVGDYVNGHLVFDKAPNCVYIEDNQNKMAHIPYTKDNIESVLTKELFENMEYKIC